MRIGRTGLALACGLALVTRGAGAWQVALDGSAKGPDTATAVAVDAAGNVVAAGSMTTAGGQDLAVVKLAGTDGSPLWPAPVTVDGAAHGADAASALVLDGMGDVVVAGKLVNAGVKGDFAVLKLAGADGSARWPAPFTLDGTAADSTDEATGVAIDGNGDVLAAGYTQNAGTSLDFTVVKLAGADGSPLWPAPVTLGGTANAGDLAHAIAVDADGNALVAGFTENTGTKIDFTVVKLAAADGAELWRRTITGTTSGGVDQAVAIAVDGGGDVVAAGFTQNGSTGIDLTVVKLSGADGTPRWPAPVKVSGTGAESDDEATAVAVDGDGDVVAAGLLQHADADGNPVPDFVVVKLRGTDGAEGWRKIVGGSMTDGSFNQAFAVATDPGDNVLAGGRIENTGAGRDFALVRLAAADGVEIVREVVNGGTADQATAVAVDAAGNLVGAGALDSTDAGTDLAVVKLGCRGGEPATCTTPGQCYDAATCDPPADACAVSPDGTQCSDGDACTERDACRARACTAPDLEVVRCALLAAPADPACAADRLPRGVKRGVKRARGQVERAERATDPAKVRALAQRASARLAKVSAAIDKAAERRRRPLSEACAAALRVIVLDAQARLGRVAGS